MKKTMSFAVLAVMIAMMITMGASAQTSINLGPVPVYVNPNVTIGSPTSSVREQYVGGDVDLIVTATGVGLTYQWSGPLGLIVGATDSSLTLTNVGLADAGTYNCLVTGTCDSQTTLPITATIYEPLAGTIITNPAIIPYMLCPLGTIDLTANIGTTGKAPYVFAWSMDPGTGAVSLVNGVGASPGGGDVVGADAANLVITNAGLLDEAVPGYSCNVIDSPLTNTDI